MASIQEDGELAAQLEGSVLDRLVRDVIQLKNQVHAQSVHADGLRAGLARDIADLREDVLYLREQVLTMGVAQPSRDECRAGDCSFYRVYLPWAERDRADQPLRILAHSVYHHAEAHMAEAQRLCRDNWNGATRGGVTTHQDQPCCRNAAAWERLLGVTG